jgi:hypothetical protein
VISDLGITQLLNIKLNQRLNGKILLPEEHGSYLRQPKVVEKIVFLPDLTCGLGWSRKDAKGSLLTFGQVAEKVAKIFLRHLDDVNSGKSPPPEW